MIAADAAISPNTEKVYKGRTRVLAIVGVLVFAAIAWRLVFVSTGTHRGPNTTQIKTLGIANGLAVAIREYSGEYGHSVPVEGGMIDTASPAGTGLLWTLLGHDPANNPKALTFLTVAEGRNGKEGLICSKDGSSVTGLFDRWGHGYLVCLPDAAGQIHLPSGEIVTGKPAIVVSPGEDGKAGTSDDIISGRPLPKRGFF